MQSVFYTDYLFTYPNDNIIVSTSSVEDVPTNKQRLIDLTVNGILKPSSDIYELMLTFTGTGPSKDFLAQSYGTFCIGKKVYSADKIIKSVYDKEKMTLTLILDFTDICPYVLKKPTRFSFAIQLYDQSCTNLTCNEASCFPSYGCACENGQCITI